MRLHRSFAAPLTFCLLLAAPVLAHAAPVTRNFTFLANVNEYPQSDPNAAGYSACWSYVHGDGREYAILGVVTGTAIYNVTNPAAPYRVGFIPGPFSIWREMKSYRNWIYIVTEGTGPGNGVQIVRMTDPEHPVLANTYAVNFVRSHTVAVDTTRALLVCNGTNDSTGHATGMRVLSIANPESPVPLGSWPNVPAPVARDDYMHDCIPVGNLIYGASIYSGRACVFDFSNPTTPILQKVWSYPGAFTHNIWPTPDGKTIYVTDEVDGEPLKIFDVNDPSNPLLVNEVTSNPHAIVHNAHVWNGELYLANYTEGIRALDITDPHHPAEFATADSYFGPSGGFNGVWEVCPFFPSGIVIASDRQTGLYVYRPDRNYGIVEARVVYNDGGGPAAGVKVNLTTEGDSLVTPADGIVRFAPSPGAHTIRAHAFGFYDRSTSALVSAGQTTHLLLIMTPQPRVPFAGVVKSFATGQPVEDAEVSVATAEIPVAHSDATGHYDLGTVPASAYHLSIRRPGFIPIEDDVTLTGGFPGENFVLTPAPVYDDLESATAWTIGAPGDDAFAGAWVRVAPVGTGEPQRLLAEAIASVTQAAQADAVVASARPRPRFENLPPCCRDVPACTGECGFVLNAAVMSAAPGDIAPASDRTPGAGTMCFVTGQAVAGGLPSSSDLDGGRTTITSPRMNLTGMSDPRIGYWRWFYAQDVADDWFAVLISNDDGATWTPVDTTHGPIAEKWTEYTIRVANFVTPTDRMRVRFVAADLAPEDIVEAAVDDVTGYDAANAVVVGVGGSAAPGPLRLAAARPNPSRGDVTLELTLPVAAPLDVSIFDVNGRRVRALERTFAPAGTRALRWDGRDDSGNSAPAGLYFVRANAGGRRVETRVVRVE